MRSLLLLAPVLLRAASLETIATPSFFFYEENVGQADPSVRLLVRGAGNRTYLSSDSIYLFSDMNSDPVRVRFAPPSATPGLRSLEPWPGIVNRFEGLSQKWRRAIPAHRLVRLTAIFPNVDLILREADGYPGFTYVVQPGADPSQIFLEAEGLNVRGVVHADGRWVLSGGFFGSIFDKPRAYQDSSGAAVPVPAEFIAASEQQARFRVPSYDRTRPLYIDVDIFDGPPRSELSNRTSAVDDSGNLYFAGSFVSAMRCSTAPGGTFGFCPDAFVAGVDSQGQPMFLTVLAGQYEDFATHLAVAPGSGDIVVTGSTASSDFPVTANAYQSTNAGPLGPRPRLGFAYIGDIFVSRIHPRNGDLLYSTFIGSPDGDAPTGLTLASGSVSILAESGSRFPTTSNAWMPTSACQSCISSVALRLSSTGSRLLFATYLPAFVRAMAGHADGTLYFAGDATSEAPTTAGSLQTELRGPRDLYLLRLASDGSRPVFATYYGGSGQESAHSIVVNPNGEAWVHGSSDSTELVPDPAGRDFVLRIASNGSRLLTSRFLRYVSSGDLLLDDAGGILLTGISPVGQNTSSDALQRGACGGQSPFLWRLDNSGNVQLATYFPAETVFEKGSTAVGPGGSLMVISPRRIQRIALDQPTPMSVGCVLSAGYLLDLGRFSPGQIVTLIGAGMGSETGVTAQPENGRFPKSLAGVRVLINNIPAPLLYVQAGQINTIVPYAVPPGTQADVVVEYNGRRTAPLRASVLGSDFSIFTASMSGHGQAAALNQDGSINSAGNPARAGSIVVLYGTGGGVTDPPSEDGAIAPLAHIPRPIVPIQVLIQYYGLAEVLYVGPAPGLVNGAFQINFRLPDIIPAEIRELAVGVATPHAPAPALAATIAVR